MACPPGDDSGMTPCDEKANHESDEDRAQPLSVSANEKLTETMHDSAGMLSEAGSAEQTYAAATGDRMEAGETHESASALGDHIDTGDGSSCQKESWETYMKWLSTAEFGDGEDELLSDSDSKDTGKGDATRRDKESFKSSRNKGASISRDGGVGRKRKSRWEPLQDRERDRPSAHTKRSHRSPEKHILEKSHARDVQIPGLCTDPEFLDLKIRLIEINRKLRTGQVLDDEKRRRSRSPAPVCDNLGNRINTRENRARERLNQERQLILERMAKQGPSGKVPIKHKFSTKVFFPAPHSSEANRVPSVIGRVEKETGARLYIQGRTTRNSMPFNSNNAGDEMLHVRIEADGASSLNMAATMVRNLLFTAEGRHSEVKSQEQTTVDTNPRANVKCYQCKKFGHYRKECPLRPKSLTATAASNMASGSGLLGTKGGMLEQGMIVHGNNALGGGLPGATGALSGGMLGLQAVQNPPQVNLGAAGDIDIYAAVGNLPPSMDDGGLLLLFSPFGDVTLATVVRDHGSGFSLGYGFVRFLRATDAAQAAAVINGCRVGDRVLQVKLTTPDDVAANGFPFRGNFQQEQQQVFAGRGALQSYAPLHPAMPSNTAAQLPASSNALQGKGPRGSASATSSGPKAHGSTGELNPQKLSSSKATEAGASGSNHPSNGNTVDSQKQPAPKSATEVGVVHQQVQKQPIPRNSPHASSHGGKVTRNGSTVPPPLPYSVAANFFGQFMMAAAAAAAAANSDQRQLRRHGAAAGAVQTTGAAPPFFPAFPPNMPPLNFLNGVPNLFGGLPPPGPLQAHPRDRFSGQGGNPHHNQHGSK